jgi:hypothetical protein
MRTMGGTCENCGLLLAAGDTYCGSCGQPTTVAATAAASANGGWPGYRSMPMPEDAALGQRTPNEQYLGHRLVYDKVPEGSFDPLGNPRLLVQFVRHAVQYVVVYFLGAFLASIALLFLHLVGLSLGAAATLWVIGAALTWLLLGCLYWLLPVPALLSEWKFSVDDKGAVAPVTFEHITWAVRRHETPLDLIQVRRLNLAGGESRDYLELRRGLFTGFISCFAYGQDLYVGWTFYLRISPLRYLLMALARIWQTLKRQGTDLYVTLRFDYARAMREAMHSVAREGVDVAVGQARPQGEGIIGQAVPVAVSEIDT